MSKLPCQIKDCEFVGDSPRSLSMHMYSKHGLSTTTAKSNPTVTPQQSLSGGKFEGIDDMMNRQMQMAFIKSMNAPQQQQSQFSDFIKFYEMMEKGKKETSIDEFRKWMDLSKEFGSEEDSIEKLIIPLLMKQPSGSQEAFPSEKKAEQTQTEFKFNLNEFVFALPLKLKNDIIDGTCNFKDFEDYRGMFEYLGYNFSDNDLKLVFESLRQSKGQGTDENKATK